MMEEMEGAEPIVDEVNGEPNLWTFVSHVEFLTGSVLALVQFYFCVSYVAGKHFFEWLCWLLFGIWDFFCVSADGLKALFDAVIELEKSILRGVLLTRFGIDALFEALQVTILDVIAFGQQVFDSLVQILYTAISTCAAFVFTTPQNICTTLSLIGDTSIEIATLLIVLIRNFLVKLVWSPINLIIAACQFGLIVAALPGKFFTAIPWSAHIGSVVLILVYVVYCKLSFVRFARLIMRCCLYLVNIARGLPNILRQLFTFRPSMLTTTTFGSDSPSSSTGKGMCVVCFENPVNFLAYPCNHLCLCSNCVHVLVEIDHPMSNRCPICRLRVDHYARVYVS